MRNIPQPSRAALQSAWELGRQMAKTERRLIPILSGAHQYVSYPMFLAAHRHRLEMAAVYGPWEARLHALSDREAVNRRLKLDDQAHWDLAHTHIYVPLRCSFWFGWEGVYRLQMLYEQQVELHRRQTEAPTVLRVFNPPQSPLIPCSPIPDKFTDDDRWDSMVNQMFETLDGDNNEQLWEMPDPQQIAQKHHGKGH